MSSNEPAPKRQKRARDEPDPAPPPLPEAPPPVFGANQNFPFVFGPATRALGKVWRPREKEQRERVARDQNTTNHFHVHLPPAPAPQSDTLSVFLRILKLFFCWSLALVFLYLVVQSIHTVQRDVEQRISRYRLDIVQDIAMCALHYKNNLCAINLVPAMAHQCASWETCVNQDPTIVSRGKVTAEMVAEMLNSFVEAIGLKTLAVVLMLPLILARFMNPSPSPTPHERLDVRLDFRRNPFVGFILKITPYRSQRGGG
ncbi:hypothetical protein FIBSPDRAFT_933658 [Athelia psychrophila]|uniref:Brl1/Brr6 domain-containing protein n=1 Tax=Athelia psychrophila TaxID=1759441 RepID=A0A166GQ14_9AGAM|nr:hypothetical protein FIBSPDRAFT_933658 [Fibularhizoctonia sp. CBS 109695]